MKRTKKEYEQYLNDELEKMDCPRLSIKPGTYLKKPGTWMRKNDPIQFEVGYQEYCDFNRLPGED